MKKKDRLIAFLGPDTEFEGQLKFIGTIRLDGRFKGKISGSGNLIVGEKARIDAEIRVAGIVVSGRVSGNIRADESIEILVPGKVTGDVQAPNVVIQKGAILKGSCLTQKPNAPKQKNASSPDAINKPRVEAGDPAEPRHSVKRKV